MNHKNSKTAYVHASLSQGLPMLNKPAADAREVLYEDIARRGERTKHFRLPNGNLMAVLYDHPIHKRDTATGGYRDITPEVSETEAAFLAAGDGFSVQLPKSNEEERFIRVEKEGREVAFSLIPKRRMRHAASRPKLSHRKKGDPWAPDVTPTVTYAEADDGVDLQYELCENGVKESILLAKDPGYRVFSFQLRCRGLTPTLSHDRKSVLFLSGSTPPGTRHEMRIPPAFMEDASGELCDALHYELREDGDDHILDLVAETDWLANPERVYPVVLDPRVEIAEDGEGDLAILELRSDGSSVTAENPDIYRCVGQDTEGVVHRLYLDLTLPELADGFRIAKAGLLLYQNEYTAYDGTVRDFHIMTVTNQDGTAPDLSGLTWGAAEELTEGQLIDVLHGYDRGNNAKLDIDMTSLVTAWYDRTVPFCEKRCLLIRKATECVGGSACHAAYLTLHSKNALYRFCPRLYVEYASEDMHTDHREFHTFENGRAGTGSVDLFTGKMSFAHGDVTAEGVRLPLAVSHLFRAEFTERDENAAPIPGRYGIGWRLSVEQHLEVMDRHGIAAVYTNARGKRHYFLTDTDNGTGAFRDDAGMGLVYRSGETELGGVTVHHTLTDEKGNRMGFDALGRLVRLVDTNGNVGALVYSDGRLTEVLDGNKSVATLHDGVNGMLERIEDSEGRAIFYRYDSAGHLIRIEYPAAETACEEEGTPTTVFGYDSAHRLLKITDRSGLANTLTYDLGGRVTGLVGSGSLLIGDGTVTPCEEETDDPITIGYGARSTTVTDVRSGVRTVYRLDENGRRIASYLDKSGAADPALKSDTTEAELSEYSATADFLGASVSGKYRSLSVGLKNDAKSEVNLLQNGHFTECEENGRPTGWTVANDGTVSEDCYLPEKSSFCISTSHWRNYLRQTVTLCEEQATGNVLVASAWARAVGNVAAAAAGAVAKLELVLEARYENGNVERYVGQYDPDCHDWQYVAVPLVLDGSMLPAEVTVTLSFASNTGVCHFANARLVTVDGIVTTNTYSTAEEPLDPVAVFGTGREVRMITTKKDSSLTTVDYVDNASDIVCTVVTDKNGNSFKTEYRYDGSHNLIKTRDYRGLIIEYTYNALGKELTRKTYHESDPDGYLFSEYTYEADRHLASERDPRYSYQGEELKTTYQHDTDRSLLLKQAAVDGQEYHYAYDDVSDDLLSLSSATDGAANENRFYYTRGYLTGVGHNGFRFGFSFDALGRSHSVSVGDPLCPTTLMTYTYGKEALADRQTVVYATGERSETRTDLIGNPVECRYTDAEGNTRTVSTATYDASGKLTRLLDNERGVCYHYTYNARGDVARVQEADPETDTVTAENHFLYDASGRLTSRLYGATGQAYHPIYETDAYGRLYPDNELIGVSLYGKFIDRVTKDGLRRAAEKTFTVGTRPLFRESYSYLSTPHSGKRVETEIVSGVTSEVIGTDATSESLQYTYDKAGNLETVSNGTSLLHKYYYDGLRRLVREDNHTAGRTYVFGYDAGGNILFKKEYALCTDVNLGACLDTKTYTYKTEGWRDQLLSFDGEACVYDLLGNPTTYRGHALTWTKVRRLSSFGTNIFSYGANGIRYQKNNTVYTLDGNKILRESDGTKTLTYYHGGSGIVGFGYNGTDYYFRKNLQGDVTEIYTSDGLKVASYAYDAWGKVLAVNNYTDDNIGDLNPIRYRSYYYDVETELYYLNSRYYDPEVGRFVSADTTDVLENAQYDINGLNLYAYCDNNPVAGRDDGGDMSFWKKLAIAAAVVVAVAVVAAVLAPLSGGTSLCAAATVFACAAKGAAIGAVTGALTGAATGAVQGAVEGYQETGTLEGTLRGMGTGAMKGAVEGAKDGMISGMVSGAFAGAALSMSGNPMFCFVAGTTVLTTLGKKAIETVRVGDTIPCVDHITGEASEKKVISTTVNKVDRLIELDIDGEIIQCTETHPFQVKGRGWIEAADLAPNDVVYTKDWNTATVNSVNLLELDEAVEVFNFEVEDYHTYFVGDGCILVHNLGCTQTNTSGVGQKHHPFSRKIVRAANENPNLKGHVTRNSGTVKALTADGHKGYQDWHRKLDDKIVKWIGENKKASLSDFTNYMNRLYSDRKMLDIFGPVLFS